MSPTRGTPLIRTDPWPWASSSQTCSCGTSTYVASHPPASAAKNVQLHVSRLRKAFGSDDCGATIVTHGRGYELRVSEDAVDAVWTKAGVRFLRRPRVATRNIHGTGCTFSAAIAARHAQGDEVSDALEAAKDYVARALHGARDWALGGGHGPLDHFGWSAA